MLALLADLGADVEWLGRNEVRVHAAELAKAELDEDLARQLRGSILLAGPLLGGAVALWRLSAVFGVAGLAVAAGVIPMLQLRETLPAAAAAATARPRFEWWRLRGVLVPSLALAALGTVSL